MDLRDVLEQLAGLPEQDREFAVSSAREATKNLLWIPNPGPQTAAYFSKADELFYGGQAGGGKGLALDTPLPTPFGWTTMADVQVGDTLFDERGAPCSVTAVSEISNRPCYRLTFDDGSTLVADDVHRWVTLTEKDLATTGRGEMRDTETLWRTRRDEFGGPAHAVRIFEKVAALRKDVSGLLYLVACEPIESVPTKCIAVDSPTRMYLAGKAFIPTHNTDLECGLALTAHTRSLILRRTNKEALGLVDRLAEIIGNRDGWNAQQNTWRLPDGRIIEIGGCQLTEDRQKYKGIPRDLYLFDEVSDFEEAQYTFIIGWNRSATPGQRCRVVCAGNPPTRPEGLWVIQRWAAWLDPTHPNPARAGELRWYTTIDGKDTEVDGPGPHLIPGESQPIMARSRTFIPAKLSDNPDLAATDYASVLASLPEELRAAYRDGRFDTMMQDDAFQAIPTSWVKAAQERWTDTPPVGVPMCAIGVDVAQGGQDNTVLAIRHDGWFANPIITPGAQTPDGKKVAGLVIAHRRDNAKVIVDIGGGWGGDAYAHLRENLVDASSYMGVKPSSRRTIDNTLRFTNVRTEAYWRFREALDPSQPQGSAIALPPDPILLADLCAPKYSVSSRGLSLESKEDVVKRLGRSPDRGDAVIMCWFEGIKGLNMQNGWAGSKRAPRVVTQRP